MVKCAIAQIPHDAYRVTMMFITSWELIIPENSCMVILYLLDK